MSENARYTPCATQATVFGFPLLHPYDLDMSLS